MSDSPVRIRVPESRRRRVLQFVAVYAVAAWLAIQVAATTFPYLGLPSWLVTAVIVLAGVGFLVGLPLAWALEPAPGGRRRLVAVAALAVLLVGVGALAVLGRRSAGGAAVGAAYAAPALEQVTFSAAVEEFPAFSPDGARLAFSREVDGFRQIFVRGLDGSGETQLTHERRDHIQPAWGPDGQVLVYVQADADAGKLMPRDVFDAFEDGADVWRVQLTTGRSEAILDDAFNPSFSPDGERLAFDASWGGVRRIWVADAFGRNQRQITTDASEAVRHVHPRWAPDGRRLVIQRIEKTTTDIHTVDVTTGARTPLTNDLFTDVDPTWTPDGAAVVFSSYRGGGLNLWRLPVTDDGGPAGPPHQLTTGAGQDVQPAVDPSGSRVAFVTLNLNADLWRLPVDPATGRATGEPTPLVSSTREDTRGAWSPDGRSVVFSSDRAGAMNIWVHDVHRDSFRQITRGPGGDYQPRWAPDGRWLVFFSSRAGNADIWRVDVTGLELRQLTTSPALDVNPFVSPDGATIAFQSDREGRKEVWIMSAAGEGERRLTSHGASDHFMAWTADGAAIVYRSHNARDDRQSGLFRIGLDGAPPRRLAADGGAHASFAPDSSLVMDVQGHRLLYVAPAAGGPRVPVFEFDDPDVRIDYPAWSPDGRWVVFDRTKPAGGDVWLLRYEPRRPAAN